MIYLKGLQLVTLIKMENKTSANGWRCSSCGGVYGRLERPEGFVCPFCGAEQIVLTGIAKEYFDATVGIYSQSKLIRKIARCASETQGAIRRIQDVGFCSERYAVEFLSYTKINDVVKVFKEPRARGNRLFDYDYQVFQDDFLRCFVLLRARGDYNFTDYTVWFKMSEVDFSLRRQLYDDVCKLLSFDDDYESNYARGVFSTLPCSGITLHPHDVFYNPIIKDFKLMDFQRVGVGRYDDEDVWEYQEAWREYCQIPEH